MCDVEGGTDCSCHSSCTRVYSCHQQLTPVRWRIYSHPETAVGPSDNQLSPNCALLGHRDGELINLVIRRQGGSELEKLRARELVLLQQTRQTDAGWCIRFPNRS